MRQILSIIAGLIAVCAVMTSNAWAQSALSIRVVNDAGAPVVGAAIKADNTAQGTRRTAQTDGRGRARLSGLAPGSVWQVRAEKSGLSTQSAPIALRTDFTSSVVLTLATSDADVETISVVATAPVVRLNTTNAEVSATLTAAQIKTLPVEARSLERLLFRLPGVTQSTGFFGEAPSVAINGANALFTSYLIDGLDNGENFLGGQKFPLPVGAVEDVTVLTSSYSAEFGRTANGVVNVTTPSGSNDFEGTAVFVTRPGGFLTETPDGTQTSLFGAPVSDSFSRYQGAISLSGPIAQDRAFFFLNAEYVTDQTDNILSAPQLGIAETLPGTNRQLLITANLTGQLSDAWSAGLRINYGDVDLERQGGGLDGGVTFPSAGSVQARTSTNIAATLSYAGNAFTYRGALQHSRFDWDFGRALSGRGPQVTVFDDTNLTLPVAVLGHPGFVFDSTERTWQTRHVGTWDKGDHQIKLGADVIRSSFALEGGGNVNGNYRVSLPSAALSGLAGAGAALDVADLPAGQVTVLDAVFETQPNRFGRAQTIYSLILEDQWQLTNTLSLTGGLRWDYDSLTSAGPASGDFDNISPRIGFNYAPTPDLSIRGGIGRYIEKIPYAVVSDAIQQNSRAPGFLGQLEALQAQGILPVGVAIDALTTSAGNRTVDASGQCAGFLMCPDPASLRSAANTFPIAERRIFNPFGLENPEAIQASVSVSWRATPTLILGVDGQYSRGRNLLRLIDLNAPAPFDFNQTAFDALGANGVAALTPAQRSALGLIRPASAADLTRPALNADGSIPAGGARSILYTDSGGRSRYLALIFKIQKARGRDWYDASVFYTLSSLKNDTDDINFRADDANRFTRDFGPSLNDRRHVISSLVTLYPVEGLTISLAGLIQSGQPINFTPDPLVFGTSDINGDGLSFADQFTGNPDRAPGISRNARRLGWSAVFDIGVGYALETSLGQFSLRGDLFNVFNANTETGFPVNFTASNQVQTLGQPFVQRSAGPARTFQLTAQYAF